MLHGIHPPLSHHGGQEDSLSWWTHSEGSGQGLLERSPAAHASPPTMERNERDATTPEDPSSSAMAAATPRFSTNVWAPARGPRYGRASESEGLRRSPWSAGSAAATPRSPYGPRG